MNDNDYNDNEMPSIRSYTGKIILTYQCMIEKI